MITNHNELPKPAELFGAGNESIVPLCPALIREAALELIEAFGEAPEPVVAAMLCVAAAAIGNRFRLAIRDGQSVPAGFNMAVGHYQPRELDWLDFVGSPLVYRVFSMETALYREKPSGIRRELKEREEELAQAKKTERPDPDLLAQAGIEIARLKAHLAPSCILPQFSMERIADQIGFAFDQGLLSVAGASDPLDDFGSSTPAERRELCCGESCGTA